MQRVTLLFLLRDDQILLAYKKRGFGQGKWNGVGGKVNEGEDPKTAAIRECQEEICVTPTSLKQVAVLHFFEKTDPSFHFNAFVFTATEWTGAPTETEEMRPKWYNLSDIPYDQMWADDPHWLPLVLDGKLVEGTCTLDGDILVEHDIKIVDALSEEIT